MDPVVDAVSDLEEILAEHTHEWGDGLETVYCTGCEWSCDGYAEPVDIERGYGGWYVAFQLHVIDALIERGILSRTPDVGGVTSDG